TAQKSLHSSHDESQNQDANLDTHATYRRVLSGLATWTKCARSPTQQAPPAAEPLKPRTSNRAGAATKGAGGGNHPLRPNPWPARQHAGRQFPQQGGATTKRAWVGNDPVTLTAWESR